MQKVQLGCHLPEDSDTTLNNISLLALPEHHIRFSWDAHCIKDKGAWGLFSFLESDIVRHKDMCK